MIFFIYFHFCFHLRSRWSEDVGDTWPSDWTCPNQARLDVTNEETAAETKNTKPPKHDRAILSAFRASQKVMKLHVNVKATTFDELAGARTTLTILVPLCMGSSLIDGAQDKQSRKAPRALSFGIYLWRSTVHRTKARLEHLNCFEEFKKSWQNKQQHGGQSSGETRRINNTY